MGGGASKTFDDANVDGDQELDATEFAELFKGAGCKWSDERITKLFEAFDGNSSGTIDLVEFMGACSQLEAVAKGKKKETTPRKPVKKKVKKGGQCKPAEHEFKFGRCSRCGMEEGKLFQEKQQVVDDAIGREKPDWDKVPGDAKPTD